MESKKGIVHSRLMEPKTKKCGCKLVKPCSRACLSPQMDILSFQTCVGKRWSTKTGGCFMYTSSSKVPWRKALETSSCLECHKKCIAIARIVQIVVKLTTGLEVLVLSIPFFCSNPLATNLALNLSRDPSHLCLTSNTHLLLITFLWSGWGHKV